MDPEELKEAYRLFWLVKGHISASPETAMSSAPGYFRRLWIDGSNGAPIYEYEEGFEEAYQKKLLTNK
tara:strand:+ start:43 stop:246 length:204 start_codon:yes stop_codon:yes gene_type:complete